MSLEEVTATFGQFFRRRRRHAATDTRTDASLPCRSPTPTNFEIPHALSLARSASGLSHLRCGNVADSRRVPPRPPTVPACLPDEHNPPPSPASLHLDLTKEGGIHAAEKFLSFSLRVRRTYRKSPSLHAALTPAIGPLRKECTRKGTVVVNSCSGLNLGIGI